MKNKKIFFVIFIFTLGVLLLVTSLVINKKSNDKIRNEIYENTQIFTTNYDSDETFTYTLNDQTSWDNSGVFKYNNKNFKKYQYSLDITNTISKNISYYKIRFDVNSDILVQTMWCGTIIEAHQFRDGKEIVENFDFESKTYNALDVIEGEEEKDAEGNSFKQLLIRFKEGDYFIYYPGYRGWETPLQQGGEAHPGFISYQESDLEKIDVGISFIFDKYTATSKNNIKLSLESRGEVYGRCIDDSNPNFVMDTFDLNIKNSSKKELSSYNFKMTAHETMYLNNMWNGSIEVHQFSDGKEIVQTLDDPRKIKKMYLNGELNLNYLDYSGEISIVLNDGDYLIYSPYEKDIDNLGLILIYPNNESIPKISITFTYNLKTSITNSVWFWLSIFLFFVLITYIIINISLYQKTYIYKRQKARDEETILESMKTFINFIDAKDPYTKGHSSRVAEYSRKIASELGFSEEEAKRVYYIGLMHDCGKIGIPDNILTKPDKLTKEEYEIIKSHTTKGYEILKDFTSIDGIKDGVLYHHERYDGSGYPKGLKGDKIPLIARIICVSDAYDAMTSKRCYRNPLNKEEVIKELKKNRGTQFDPKIVDVFLKIIR